MGTRLRTGHPGRATVSGPVAQTVAWLGGERPATDPGPGGGQCGNALRAADKRPASSGPPVTEARGASRRHAFRPTSTGERTGGARTSRHVNQVGRHGLAPRFPIVRRAGPKANREPQWPDRKRGVAMTATAPMAPSPAGSPDRVAQPAAATAASSRALMSASLVPATMRPISVRPFRATSVERRGIASSRASSLRACSSQSTVMKVMARS